MPGTILVGDIKHVRADLGVEIDSADLDKTRLAIGQQVPAMERSRTVVFTVSLI